MIRATFRPAVMVLATILFFLKCKKTIFLKNLSFFLGGAIPQFSFFLENECQNMFSHNILHQKSGSPKNLRHSLTIRGGDVRRIFEIDFYGNPLKSCQWSHNWLKPRFFFIEMRFSGAYLQICCFWTFCHQNCYEQIISNFLSF